MNVPIEAPIEIKKKIAKKLQKSGALKRIERKIKLGMMVAVEEIKSEPTEKTHLERLPFKDATINEIKGLQAIYSYLAKRNMTYTLSTLLEESCVKRQTNTNYDLLEVIESANKFNSDEEKSIQSVKKTLSQKQSPNGQKLPKNKILPSDYSDDYDDL
ncbi:hypothetical protein TVAG_494340 [Trichomonas vaginalis G3]|uniref:Uncharacterized protein n=1 Tax=Trichomonas vaginalis (strain ATCC PRA-98 / G3) TaxID=412133 RepID=A2DQ65_TRIV3|nr:hypothetical protein TVAGG3_0385490 [Trichomonas vaginalis G3]EAY17492.1 hypothetical protein TVAG_494340 [Trichomonas vaginalis G3]KAI5533598.1 hypothetical protein TVAGG3_0385490 [Trichomonas vaginalis G3]|eukprot:XP_001329627.1 hypothetical protein [Trichomonas vaginalis G3]